MQNEPTRRIKKHCALSWLLNKLQVSDEAFFEMLVDSGLEAEAMDSDKGRDDLLSRIQSVRSGESSTPLEWISCFRDTGIQLLANSQLRANRFNDGSSNIWSAKKPSDGDLLAAVMIFVEFCSIHEDGPAYFLEELPPTST